MLKFTFLLIAISSACVAATIQEKVLICGICKNVENAVANTIRSVEELGSQFLDYKVIIYENNSTDKTKELFQNWARKNRHVLFFCENLRTKKIAKQLSMKVYNRTEALARARNKVLDIAMQQKYSDYKYVIWADLDFTEPWDVENIVETILHPEQKWDAVLANGAYDLFAYRDAEFPIGFELIGNRYWQQLDELRARFSVDPTGPWKRVYSAFGGLGIYKRDSIKGCHYAGTVTKDLEDAVAKWLEKAECAKDVCFLDVYKQLLATTRIVDLKNERVFDRNRFPDEMGLRLKNGKGIGKIAWFSCTPKVTLPWTCEHLPFHASMARNGHDKIFVNPHLISNHP